MNINPYKPPLMQPIEASCWSTERVKACRSIRVALFILLVPAVYNFICFNFPASTNQPLIPIPPVYRVGNLIGLVMIVAAVWFFGLLVFEFITGGVHSVSARHSKLIDWNTELYKVLSRLPNFAVPGAVLWGIWVSAFYQTRIDFYIISVPIGVAAHVLAACQYVPLIYRWYRIERNEKERTAASVRV